MRNRRFPGRPARRRVSRDDIRRRATGLQTTTGLKSPLHAHLGAPLPQCAVAGMTVERLMSEPTHASKPASEVTTDPRNCTMTRRSKSSRRTPFWVSPIGSVTFASHDERESPVNYSKDRFNSAADLQTHPVNPGLNLSRIRPSSAPRSSPRCTSWQPWTAAPCASASTAIWRRALPVTQSRCATARCRYRKARASASRSTSA
jgi:hypothetical protein